MQHYTQSVAWKILCVICFLAPIIYFGSKANEALEQMPITEVDLSTIPDGTYQGTFADHGFLWQMFGKCYRVETKVQAHRIVDVAILGDYDKESVQKAKDVLQEIVQQQKINVPPVPSAVKASKCLLKAVENSLTQKSK